MRTFITITAVVTIAAGFIAGGPGIGSLIAAAALGTLYGKNYIRA